VQVRRLDAAVSWRFIGDVAAHVLETALQLQQIAAPTFAEHDRALWVAGQFRALDLEQVSIDAHDNVYGLLRASAGDAAGPAVLVSAHTDTVFPAYTDLAQRREGSLIFGPGLGDNTVGVTAMFGAVEALRRCGIPRTRDIWFVATTREEGLGDLQGMRAAFAQLGPRIDRVINLEGLALGHVYHAGIAVRRLHIAVTVPGGHSWLHFGRPSAVHLLVNLGAQITALNVPDQPRTTYNIGLIEGGDAINAIAARAGLWLDMRSESAEMLARFEAQVRALVAATEAAHLPDAAWSVEVVGDRPAGAIAPDHPLVAASLAALDAVGLRGVLETGSTDSNVPLAHGIPAVTVGITRGGNAHRLDEYIETTPIAQGLRQLTLLILSQTIEEAP
jgi:acetylornithine deacetylase/succinyl-diaminopimelate desuccinylase-like protein